MCYQLIARIPMDQKVGSSNLPRIANKISFLQFNDYEPSLFNSVLQIVRHENSLLWERGSTYDEHTIFLLPTSVDSTQFSSRYTNAPIVFLPGRQIVSYLSLDDVRISSEGIYSKCFLELYAIAVYRDL